MKNEQTWESVGLDVLFGNGTVVAIQGSWRLSQRPVLLTMPDHLPVSINATYANESEETAFTFSLSDQNVACDAPMLVGLLMNY